MMKITEKDQRIVLAGEDVTKLMVKGKKIIGPGLIESSGKITAINSGVLRYKKPITYWIDYLTSFYTPVRGECVIGIVTEKKTNKLKLDLGTYMEGWILYSAFEGSTKKNKPRVDVGDLIFGKVLPTPHGTAPELACINSSGQRGEFGVLSNDGFMFSCSINLIRKILDKNCPLLKKISDDIPYEITVGMNGRIWIKTGSILDTMAAVNIILESEYLQFEKMPNLCDFLFNERSKIKSDN